MALKTVLFSSIRDVPRAEWENIAVSHSLTFSYAFWDMLEQSRLPNFVYSYVILYNAQEEPVAAATLYSVSTDIAIFAPGWLRVLLTAIRRLWPGFLILRMLECGTPVTLNSPPFIATPSVSVADVLVALHEVMMQKAHNEKQFLIVIRDFEANADFMQPVCRKLGYHWVSSLPNTYLDVRWDTFNSYLSAMKSYYRCKIVKHQKRAASHQFSHILVNDFSADADILHKQWMVVHEQADEFQREILTAAFYRHFSALDVSRALMFYQDNTLVGHALLCVDNDMLRWLYFGRTKAVNDSLYLYVGHSVIQAAITLGLKRIEMGLTTYDVKQDMGADVMPINLAVRTRMAWLNSIVGILYPLLNYIPATKKKDVFKG